MTTLWAEGLGVTVNEAVERAVARGVRGAATVRRLAREPADETERHWQAMMN